MEAIAKALHQASLKRALGRRKAIETPKTVFASLHQSRPSQVREMPRHGRLRDLQNLYQVSDAHFAFKKQMQNSKSRRIRKGTKHQIDLRFVHTPVYSLAQIYYRSPLQERVNLTPSQELSRLIPSVVRRSVAEAVGTALLLAAVVGSGIMGERLCSGNLGLTLLVNAIATGTILAALISTLSNISGAHFNPAVTLAEAWRGSLPWNVVPYYLVAQFTGAYLGVAAANVMFGLPIFFSLQHLRHGRAQLFSEFVATFGLLIIIQLCGRLQPRSVAFAVGAYITAAYWFTASTSFANPAVTLARSASDTFVGIRLSDVPGFVAAQLLGAASATGLFLWILPASQHGATNTAPAAQQAKATDD